MSKGMSRKIEEVTDIHGQIEIKLDPNSRKLARNVGSIVVDSFYKLTQSETLSAEVEDHLRKAAQGYEGLGSQMKFLAATFGSVARSDDFEPFKKLADLYDTLHQTFKAQAGILQEEAKSFGKNIRMMLDFSVKELEGFEDVSIKLSSLCSEEMNSLLYTRKRRMHSSLKKMLHGPPKT